MSVYYNEIDPSKAEWMRQLMARGVIARGVVDERSIEDVKPGELLGYRQCHFFAGIGIWSYALRLAGWPDDEEAWSGSCPCQPFSVAGEGKGTLDERHLWPAWFNLISKCRPRVVFGEQVADGGGITWLDAVQTNMESEGYRFGPLVLPAAGFGSPHGRHRIMFVADSTDLRCDRGGAGEKSAHAGKEQEFERLCNARDGVVQDDAITTRLERHSGDGKNRNEPGRNGEGPNRPTAAAGATGNMGDSERHGLRGRRRPDAIKSDKSGDGEIPGPCNGYWRIAGWVYCRPEPKYPHGCYRAVEPVPVEMADGLAASLGRVRDSRGQSYFHPLQVKASAKKLRLAGYGDGIVAPAIAEFIKAYMSIRANEVPARRTPHQPADNRHGKESERQEGHEGAHRTNEGT